MQRATSLAVKMNVFAIMGMHQSYFTLCPPELMFLPSIKPERVSFTPVKWQRENSSYLSNTKWGNISSYVKENDIPKVVLFPGLICYCAILIKHTDSDKYIPHFGGRMNSSCMQTNKNYLLSQLVSPHPSQCTGLACSSTRVMLLCQATIYLISCKTSSLVNKAVTHRFENDII